MQGAVSQAMAMITILLANFAHAPVSTTHIVSSSVAGTMVAEPDGTVQSKTIKTILLAWVFTFTSNCRNECWYIYTFKLYFQIIKLSILSLKRF